MAPHAIVSYDDTQNDHDALALGRTLARRGRPPDAAPTCGTACIGGPDARGEL